MKRMLRMIRRGCRALCGASCHTIDQRINGTGNTVQLANPESKNVKIAITGDNNRVTVEPDCVLKNVSISIQGNGHVCHIGKGCIFEEYAELCMEDQDGRIEIGDRSYFGGVKLSTAEPGSSIRIGQACLFAYDIDVRCSDAHSILDASTGKRINPARDVNIADHVWVAARCIILKGVSIATHSVVAAGSVVTKSFEDDGVVIAGNPGRVVRENITWDAKRIIARDSP